MLDRSDVIHPLRGIKFARDFKAAEAIEEDIEFMWIAQTQRVGGKERRRRNDALRVDGEGVDRVQNAVLDRVEKLEISDDVVCTEGRESQLSTGLFLDAGAPVLEDLQPCAAGPACLDLPVGTVGRGRCDMWRGQSSGAKTGNTGQRLATRYVPIVHLFLPLDCRLAGGLFHPLP